MPNFTKEQLREVMNKREFIRNMSVIAHVDHGKSTLTDSLVQKAGIISKEKAGVERHTDTRQDEIDRGITIKSTGVSMAFKYQPKGSESTNTYAINLIDSPGHVDFSSEVTAALRVTDGALVVVDCIEGVCVQTETVLRQAIAEKVRPVLLLNKMDRVFLELHMDPREAYLKFRKVIEDINVILAAYKDDDLGDLQLDPRDCTVAFGSGYHQWAFTLRDFAKLNALKMCSSKEPTEEELAEKEEMLMKYMWDDYYYDTARARFTKKKPSNDAMNVFCQLVFKPINSMINSIMQGGEKNVKKYTKMISKYGIKLSEKEREMEGKHLAKAVMRNWLPASECMMKMIIDKLPSPIEAQKYRAKHLYTGPQEGAAYEAMANCDPDGPVMMYVSKMVPVKAGAGQFYAFGRLFSGTIQAGMKYRVMGPNYEPGKKLDLHMESAQRVVTLMASKADSMSTIPCGNTCALVGMKSLIKTGTISSDPDAYPIKDMRFAVSPVVQCAVSVKDPKMLQKMVEGLNRLRKSDPSCLVFRDKETKENIVAGVGELHLEILLKDLSDFMNGAELNIKDPIVAFRETLIGTTPTPQLSKSKNGHNRLFVTAEPMPEGLRTDIENGVVIERPKEEKEQARYIAEKHGVDRNDLDSKRMYGFGPTEKDANMYVNSSSAVQYLDTVRDSIVQGFREASYKGPLTGEPMSGVIFRLHDAKFHQDSVHRGIGEVGPASRRSCWAAYLNAKPRIMEPIYLCGINVPTEIAGEIYSLMATRRGEVIDNVPQIGTPMTMIKAYLPVVESFGFSSELSKRTSARAFAQCTFSHYKVIEEDPLVEGTLANKIAMGIRERKKLGEMPEMDKYSDRL